MVAAGHALTAGAGADVLRAGGNAIDAAIASLAMACVCEPVLCSPGGGGFAMVRNGSSGAVQLLDFFPQTPHAHRVPEGSGVDTIHADFGTATQAFHIGPATVAIPGFADGLAALHRAGATATLADLVQPAADAARAGVVVTPFQHFVANVVREILVAGDDVAALFAPGGEVRSAGQTFRNPGLADALEILARHGQTSSRVGDAIVAVQQHRGHLRAEDLATYTVFERSPISVLVGQATVHLNPLPAASGALVAHALEQIRTEDPVALARAFAVTDEARRSDPTLLRQRGTTHVSVIDATGTACAVTTSNGEGNGELVDGFGFMLNNILGEDDVNPAGPSAWTPATRLSSAMCPTIVEWPDGRVLALGTGGSNRIRSVICQTVVRLCLGGADLDDAVLAPRLHVEDGHLDFEDQYDEPVRRQLVELFPDHRAWPEPNLFFGGVHAAARSADGSLHGCGDPRRDGAVVVA